MGVTAGGGAGGGTGGGGGNVTCTYYEVGTDTVWLGTGTQATTLTEGTAYWLRCADAADVTVYLDLITYQPAPVIDAATLARQAYKELVLPTPAPRTAPPSNQPVLVGMAAWLWLDPTTWTPQQATASLPGLSATVAATPTTLIWDTGDGSGPITCAGPATPWHRGAQRSDPGACTAAWQHSGIYTASVTVTWRVTWTASDGTSGALPDVTRTTTYPVQAQSRQAVITSNGGA